ncbi:MAG TPA: FmdB family transcriptional regulator [Opitutaceae bacterium]|nr:FmdB family transcriptional regulator [Opitutaceae bacterium]
MPIYEYYCPDNNKIYSFYAKTLAQGQTVPKCPDNPAFRLRKILSPFAVAARTRKAGGPEPTEGGGPAAAGGGDAAEDARMEAAMQAMEGEFANVDENDPRAMGRMMRRMSELTGEKLDGEMDEVVRKLEEGADPDKLEAEMGSAFGDAEGGDPNDPYGEGPGEAKPPVDPKEPRARLRARRGPPVRDPKLYDYS